jgi:RNA polymerase sigma-70 factor (ECF subfamily)
MQPGSTGSRSHEESDVTNIAAVADTEKDTEEAVVAAVRAGDEAAFALVVGRHERELQAHCYRMLGSAPEAEDLVQETFLRAWRSRARFEGRASLRSWLYRIATNACLDTIWRRTHPAARPAGVTGQDVDDRPSPLDEAAPGEAEPHARAVARESIELAFLATLQHLPARQRAVLLLRDVFGWTASDSAALLDTSVAAANSALQRARATMASHRPAEPRGWTPTAGPTRHQRAVLRCMVRAHEQADGAAVAVLAAAG